MDLHPEKWLRLTPTFKNGRMSHSFLAAAREAALGTPAISAEGRREAIGSERIRRIRLLGQGQGADTTALQLAISVLYDLIEHGWELRVDGLGVSVRRPNYDGTEVRTAKERLRASELSARDAQLRESPVRRFVSEMETRRLTSHGWVSIFDLMRDGDDLAARLKVIAQQRERDVRLELLADVVKPYLQFVTGGAVCEWTGLRLVDIWRYFRFTWSTAHKPTPGRRMMILVRDAAAPNHPVIGIASLCNSIVQQTRRDEWIGWHPQEFLKVLEEQPMPSMARWVLRSLERLIKNIYVSDLVRDGILPPSQVRRPTLGTIERLLRESVASMQHHHRFPHAADIKAQQSNGRGINWRRLAVSALYRAKRAKALARLLGARLALAEVGFKRASVEQLKAALAEGRGRRAVATILREVKAEGVGVGMMDISVCGAIAPYNALLGGKLVSMLMTSPEVVLEYRRRYARAPSLIASAMRGKPVVRLPNLVLLCTTSLYAPGSSQYNRLKIPAEAVGGPSAKEITFLPLGETLGWGSFHFSKETLNLIELYLARSGNGRRVNSIFGEGVNPRLRKIRQGFDEIGLPEDLLLHGSARLVYVVALASNFRDVLLRRKTKPTYVIPLEKAATHRIVNYWLKRWLLGRIDREGILESVALNTVAYPVKHGGRVSLPGPMEPPVPPDGNLER